MMSQCRAQDALAFAYQVYTQTKDDYGYPIYEYGRMFKGYPAATNTLHLGERLATAKDKNLVRPNVDTIYSTIFYDLSGEDVTLTIPPIPDRYSCVAFYDLYGNNYANVSSLQAHPAGEYRLTLDSSTFGLAFDSRTADCKACVRSPTAFGLILVRILTTGTEEDMSAVGKIQASFGVQKTASAREHSIAKLDTTMLWRLIDCRSVSVGEAVLRMLADLAPDNPSNVVGDRSWINDMLAHAGIANRSFRQPPSTSMQEAILAAECDAYSVRDQAGMTEDLGNGWTKGADHILGDYRSYYSARHITAMRGYLALTADQSFYPVYTGGSTSRSYRAELGPAQAYLITFKSKPRLKPTGFWSLTMYTGDGYLVPNRLSRHAIGDRSELMRGPDAPGSDESFQMLLQPANLEPPESWIKSWLPAPAAGGRLSFSLRFYGAEACMRDGTWTYPKVEKISALRG